MLSGFMLEYASVLLYSCFDEIVVPCMGLLTFCSFVDEHLSGFYFAEY